eukprot:TRINITY_DN12171_c1_g1_i1.p1 TRINITY_DN12171_c1_g1~~TRINITY_DN12171_c1_g1_i1.p1  ORF type:complete len:125 (-),score=9.03 TRINITY_DN12171_c1_g1_i1:2-376(-)
MHALKAKKCRLRKELLCKTAAAAATKHEPSRVPPQMHQPVGVTNNTPKKQLLPTVRSERLTPGQWLENCHSTQHLWSAPSSRLPLQASPGCSSEPRDRVAAARMKGTGRSLVSDQNGRRGASPH